MNNPFGLPWRTTASIGIGNNHAIAIKEHPTEKPRLAIQKEGNTHQAIDLGEATMKHIESLQRSLSCIKGLLT